MSLPKIHGIETIEVLKGARPVETLRASTVGFVGTAPDADNTKFPMNEPIAMVGGSEILEGLGDAGTAPDFFKDVTSEGAGVSACFIRVEEGSTPEATMANVIGAGGTATGIHALKHSQSELGFMPRLYAATGFTSQRIDGGRNPVAGELLSLAETRRGVVIADGPNTTVEDAIIYRNDWDSDRLMIIDPGKKCFDTVSAQTVVHPGSGIFLGVTLRVDKQDGFHYSPSNHPTTGGCFAGSARPVEFVEGDRNTESHRLFEAQITHFINDGGWRVWGNEMPTSEPLNRFFSVRRTHDIVMDSIAKAHRSFRDRPFSVQNLLDLASGPNAYLRLLKSRGIIIGGEVWLNPALNTPETWAAGQIFVSYDAEAPAPMQHIIFEFNRNTGYYAELADKAAAAIAGLSN